MNNSKLYVGNLAYSVTDLQLKELFSNHGAVREIKLIAGKGFGFVEMSNSEEAEKAKEALNGTQWEGRTMKIDEARPPSAKNSGRGFQRRDGNFNTRDKSFNSRGKDQYRSPRRAY